MATYAFPLESQVSIILEIKEESHKHKNTQFTYCNFIPSPPIQKQHFNKQAKQDWALTGRLINECPTKSKV